MTQKKRNKKVEEYWLEHYCDSLCTGLCTLCGNQGIIDTRTTAVSAAGIKSGGLNWCICPNGQLLRIANDGAEPDVAWGRKP